MFRTLVFAAAMLALSAPQAGAQAPMASSSETLSVVPDTPLTPPKDRKIRVAFLVSDPFNLIDLAGAMETFIEVQLPPYGDTGEYPFETYTVSDSRAPVKAFGGLEVTPNYTFDDAPDPDIVVMGAQAVHAPHSKVYFDYLRRMSANGKVLMSVCTGVGLLAASGLLDGKIATSHHDFIAEFSKKYPNVTFIPDKAYVRSAPALFTAGGETSGFELALHIVELYYGHDVAVRTARAMEYRGPAWQG